MKCSWNASGATLHDVAADKPATTVFVSGRYLGAGLQLNIGRSAD
jgi:hypothetical protein